MKKLSLLTVCLLFAQHAYGLEQELARLTSALNKLAGDLGGEEAPPPIPVGEQPATGVRLTAEEEEAFGPPPIPGAEREKEEEMFNRPAPPPPSELLPPAPAPTKGTKANIPAVLPPPPPSVSGTTAEPKEPTPSQQEPQEGGLSGDIKKGKPLKKTGGGGGATTQPEQPIKSETNEQRLARFKASVAEWVKNLPAKPKELTADATLNSWVDEELKQNKDWHPSSQEKELLEKFGIDVEAARAFL